MFPILLKIGPLSIKTYGVMVAIGFLIGIHYLRKNSKSFNFSPEKIMDLGLYIMISGIIGGRLLYVILNWGYYKDNLKDIFSIWSGGLVLYGGVFIATIVTIIYAKQKNMQILKLADLLAPAVLLGIGIGRLGCFSAGCCYGKETSLPFGVIFKNRYSLAPTGIKIHPTQLYESVFCFLLFILLHNFNKKNLILPENKKRYGKIFFLFLLFYSLYRFFIEYLRGDDRGPMIFELFPSQFFSIIIFIISGLMLLNLKKKEKYFKNNG